jgi:hypothetical protein
LTNLVVQRLPFDGRPVRRLASRPIETYRVVFANRCETIWSGHFVCASDDDAIAEARRLIESRAHRRERDLSVTVSCRGNGGVLGAWTWNRHAIWSWKC